jgi:hypothetical protein
VAPHGAQLQEHGDWATLQRLSEETRRGEEISAAIGSPKHPQFAVRHSHLHLIDLTVLFFLRILCDGAQFRLREIKNGAVSD